MSDQLWILSEETEILKMRMQFAAALEADLLEYIKRMPPKEKDE